VSLAHDKEVQDSFYDGILWAAVGPQPSVLALLARWGTVLGVPSAEMAKLTSIEAWTMALHRAIGTRRMLLVIDDAWTIEEALAFKVGGPSCAYMVTTRFPHIAVHFAVDGATLVRELNEDEGITLLARFAPEAIAGEPEMARTLVHSVGGLPLALVLVGNYLRIQAYSGQPRRVRAAFERLLAVEERLLLSGPQATLERSPSLPKDAPLSLQTVISISDDLLDEPGRRALRALSVFPAKPNSISEEAALAVGLAPVETLDVLTDAGLLQDAGPGRYTLHQVIADYARVHLTDTSAYERLAEYFAHYAETHSTDYAALEQESTNIFAALQTASASGYLAALARGTNAFARFMQTRGLYVQAGMYLQQAYEAAMTLHDNRGLAATLFYLGEVVAGENRGDYAQAERYLQEGLAIARQNGDFEWMCRILRPLGLIVCRRGRYAEAETYLQEGLTLARQRGDHEQICALLRTLGSVVSKRGNAILAEAYWQEGLALARQIGSPDRICVLLASLGCVLGDRGDYDQAEGYFRESLALARQIGYREDIVMSLSNLGWMASEQGDITQAEVYYQEALSIARQVQNRWLMSSTLNEVGEGYLKQQRFDQAVAIFREALACVPREEQEMTAFALYGLARALAAQGDNVEARQKGQEGLTLFEALGHHKAAEVKQWFSRQLFMAT
jgi:tetratricopeptide (TPR) repeat protein